jgi:hypothetical protein
MWPAAPGLFFGTECRSCSKRNGSDRWGNLPCASACANLDWTFTGMKNRCRPLGRGGGVHCHRLGAPRRPSERVEAVKAKIA